MKATGIVRRIDELGRVVIPKEIRRTLRIKEGDPLEIFTDREELLFKKYSPIATLDAFASGFAAALSEISGQSAAVMDTDSVICAEGEGKKDVLNKDLSDQITQMMDERKSFVANRADGAEVPTLVKGEESAFSSLVFVPVVAGGDCLGGVALYSNDEEVKFGATEIKQVQLTALLLAKQFE